MLPVGLHAGHGLPYLCAAAECDETWTTSAAVGVVPP